MLSSEAEHPNCMYEWMNHITSPEAQAQIAVWFGEAPANSRPVISRRLDLPTSARPTCEIYHADDEEFWTRSSSGRPPSPTAARVADEVCVTYDDWIQGWTEVKG